MLAKLVGHHARVVAGVAILDADNLKKSRISFNHRAKRGGSLFQGGSAERERGREATLCWRWGTPPFVSFRHKSCPKRQWIWMKLGRNDLQDKPDGWIRPFLDPLPGG